MRNFLSTILREQPDAGSGGGASADTVAVAAAAAAEAAAATAAAAAQTDPPVKEIPAAPAAKPWYLTRLSEESAKAQTAKEAQAAAERRAEAAEALAARLQAGKEPGAAAEATHEPANPTAVRAEAEKLRFFEDTVEVKNRGLTEYGAAFQDTLAVLNAVGAATNDFVADVMAVNKADAHKLFKQIADNPEKAVALAAMNSRQRIAELTRMTLAVQTKEPDAAAIAAAAAAEAAKAATAVPAARVSKAPAPAPRIDPNASQTVDGYSDAASDEEFTKKFNESMKARSGRR